MAATLTTSSASGVARGLGRTGDGACCFGYVKDTERRKLTKDSMCTIHGILWSRQLKFSQCHNRLVASLCLCAREREMTMTMREIRGVVVIKYN